MSACTVSLEHFLDTKASHMCLASNLLQCMHGACELTSRPSYKHLNGALGPQIALHDLMEAFGGIDVHEERSALAHDFSLRIELFDRSHLAKASQRTILRESDLINKGQFETSGDL